jgi:hypothetical protein
MIAFVTNRKTLVIICLLFSFSVFSQTYKITGRVTDVDTHEPLAFVNVVYGNNNLGTATNIDGYFSFQTSLEKANLIFSFVGYESKSIFIIPSQQIGLLKIELKETIHSLSEVKIVAGENPAHRIILAVVNNRDNNNPEKLSSFSYISYNKMHFTIDPKMRMATFDTIKVSAKNLNKYEKYRIPDYRDTNRTDTSQAERMEAFFAKQHIFLTESVSERKFMFPDKNQEKIIASRSSGLKQPYFILLATQLQSFSFYSDMVEVGEKKYLSPIAKGATKKYFYQIEDTIYNDRKDTVFVISFRPLKGTLFDGLKGVMQVNSFKYSLQNITAEPYKTGGSFDVRIQQKYELINEVQWFPVQLNTDLKFPGLEVGDKPDTLLLNDTIAVIRNRVLPLLGVGKSYIDMIEINPYLTPKQFNNIQLEINKDASSKDSSFWSKYRVETLDAKDRETYRVIDSIGKAEKLDAKLNVLEKITKGYFSWGIVNFDITKFLAYNRFEGLRIGLDLTTNEKIASWFSLGGYSAYGTKDNDFKYGGRLCLQPGIPSETQFTVSYSHDVAEVGSYNLLDNKSLTSTEYYRTLLINFMDHYDEYKASLKFRSLRYLKSEIFGRVGDYRSTTQYGFKNSDTNSYPYHFRTNEIGIKLKYSYKEKFMKTVFGKYSLGSNYPIVFLNITKGLKLYEGDFDYWKYEAKLSSKINFKLFGTSTFNLIGGLVNSPVPLSLNYNGYSNYGELSVDAENTFATMRMNEFFSDRFISLFFHHDFGKLLFKAGNLRPEISICQNMGIGYLNEPHVHTGCTFNTMEKGYYETGVVFGNLLKQSLIGMGIAVYYRYGPYEFSKVSNNFSIKLSFRIIE